MLSVNLFLSDIYKLYIFKDMQFFLVFEAELLKLSKSKPFEHLELTETFSMWFCFFLIE